MQFIIKKEEILRVLAKVSGAVDRKSANPILSNVLLDFSKDKGLVVVASDSSVELICVTNDLDVVEGGKITVNFRKLKDVCASLPAAKDITFELKKDRLVVLSGKTRFSLLTMPASAFPLVDINSGVLEFKVAANDFKHQLEKTAFSMADQDVRHFLNGMLLEVNKSKMYTVATDGHRLVKNVNSLNIPEGKSIRVIVPKKTILEILKCLDASNTEIEVVINISHIKITVNGFTLISKLLEGKFPDYEKVIPSAGTKEVFAKTEELKDSFIRASVLFNEKQKGVRALFSRDKITLCANSSEQDEVKEEVAADYSGTDVEVCFNARYLIDYLKVVKDETVKITLNDATSGALFGVPEEDVYVVMPMRT